MDETKGAGWACDRGVSKAHEEARLEMGTASEHTLTLLCSHDGEARVGGRDSTSPGRWHSRIQERARDEGMRARLMGVECG